MDQSITFSVARIKLQKRHWREAEELGTNQLRVLALIRQDTTQKWIALKEDKRACINLTLKQTARRVDLMARQQEERARMSVRHRQEKASLEQAFELPK